MERSLHNDRPIKSSGEYNLNFIDWNNESEFIFDNYEYINNENSDLNSIHNEYTID